jgi:hypothetical protein
MFYAYNSSHFLVVCLLFKAAVAIADEEDEEASDQVRLTCKASTDHKQKRETERVEAHKLS